MALAVTAAAFSGPAAIGFLTAFNGIGAPIWGIAIPEGYMGYSEAKKDYFSHDVEKAKEWIGKGAVPTDRVARALSELGAYEWKHGSNPKKGTPKAKAQERLKAAELAKQQAAEA